MLDIWGYVSADNENAADNVITNLRTTIERIADQPRMGRIRIEFNADLYCFPRDNYLIFYRIIPGGIRVVRVLHSARDISATL